MNLTPLIEKYDLNLLLSFGSYGTERFTSETTSIWPTRLNAG